MYAYISKIGRGFFSGVRLEKSATLFSLPSPTLAFANGSTSALCLAILAAANLFIHCCHILCLAISRRAENGLFSVHIGGGLETGI
jgi:hypothetical protein